MFQLVRNPTYWWPVKIETPGKKPGQFERQEFDAEFNWISESEKTALLEGDGASVKATVDRVFVQWRGIRNGEEEFAVTPENREALLNFSGMRNAIVMAWLESLAGDRARRKN